MDDNKISFTVTDEAGKEVECDVLFVFESPEYKKHYMVYTDNTFDEDGQVKIYASSFDPTAEEIVLGAIETDAEWDMVDKEIQRQVEEASKYVSEHCHCDECSENCECDDDCECDNCNHENCEENNQE